MYAEYTDEYTPETLLFLFDVAGINSCKKKIDLGRISAVHSRMFLSRRDLAELWRAT